jgi:2-dehydropantoate 2-reductase
LSLRITIVGAGAIGGWIAARLAVGGERVSVFARGDTLRLIRAEGIVLQENGEEAAANVDAAEHAGNLGEQDLVIIAVKAPALEAVAEEAQPLIGRSTMILPMLNGVPWWFVPGEPLRSVDPSGAIAAAMPADQVIGCVVHASCSR